MDLYKSHVVLCEHQSAVPSAPLCSGSSPSGVGSEYLSSGGGATGGRTRTLPANRKAGGRACEPITWQQLAAASWTIRGEDRRLFLKPDRLRFHYDSSQDQLFISLETRLALLHNLNSVFSKFSAFKLTMKLIRGKWSFRFRRAWQRKCLWSSKIHDLCFSIWHSSFCSEAVKWTPVKISPLPLQHELINKTLNEANNKLNSLCELWRTQRAGLDWDRATGGM